ncbi:RING-type E3 ubiquitin transferase [Ranunculus cassubicifolius]
MSSRTTPNGSRRWWRSVSDNESEGFDNLDSVYGENESVNSFGGYGAFHGEGDTVSHSVYGAGSDISVDVHSYMDRDLFTQQDNGSDIDSDTDIDPMQAGLDQWDSDDQDDENEGWGENSAEENSVTLSRNSNDYSDSSNWIRRLQGRRNGVSIEWRVQESRLSIVPNTSGNYVGNSGDYLDASGFEQLLEQLAEADSTRRGAPPAAASFVDSLPSVSINAGHVKHDDLVCAVCKDCFSIGNVVKQLPCMHLYHPSCILPWLSARNSCPLCRYELPTDDKDYEEGKRARVRTTIQEIADSESSGESEEDLSDEETETEHGELMNVDCDDMQRRGRRGGWFFLPIVSLVGFVLVCWFRNPVVGQRGNCVVQRQGQLSVSTVGQGRNRGRRWWSLF